MMTTYTIQQGPGSALIQQSPGWRYLTFVEADEVRYANGGTYFYRDGRLVSVAGHGAKITKGVTVQT